MIRIDGAGPTLLEVLPESLERALGANEGRPVELAIAVAADPTRLGAFREDCPLVSSDPCRV